MSDVDTILESGFYRDRRGRRFARTIRSVGANGGWVQWWPAVRRTVLITPAQMRLLIIRDMHRDVCPGLLRCTSHPVPKVVIIKPSGKWSFCVDEPGYGVTGPHLTFAEAVDAAIKLAEEEK